ncbi:uncharacterized protein LOC130957436 [Arachis stenosperma]|uniref:uncharacterized protein LOC130957436 n=1 Tax=Arachis stenosperma TaxID=217475 RepID=UPI0025AB6939|nr:uncharacterized protein LOC130957436 [Arachis stenosperma]
MGFGSTWRAWVKECIRSVSISIQVNGSPSKAFKMERGLRQGDPLSSFLFVLVVDVLNRMIGEAVRNDDRILFCPLEEGIVRSYKRLLRCFEVMSGLSINFEKSSLIPVNCSQEWTKKVEEKLSLWKAKVLSKARKLVLIKSVINSLPVYYLSLYKMPNAVARRIILLQRRFFWGKDDGRSSMALVKWEVIQAPKKLGGLGVGDVVVRNTALLFKWWWRFSKEDCSLWKKIILSVRGGPWRDICHLQIKEQEVRQKMIDGLAIEVGDGRTTRFWEDTWLQIGKLKDCYPRLFFISNQKGSPIGDCGFWDGIEWVWHFQWRRELRQWESETLDQLMHALQSVRLIAEVQDRVV